MIIYGLHSSIPDSANVTNYESQLQIVEYQLLGQSSLQNGVPVNGTLVNTDDSDVYTIEVEEHALNMRSILICPEYADFDLYGRLGAEPNDDIYDWLGYESGDEDETYEKPSVGIWFIMVHSYDGKGAYELTVSITYVVELQEGIITSGMLEQPDEWDIWRISVGTNVTSMNVVLECEPSDFDIYARRGDHPTTDLFDWEAGNLGNDNYNYDNPAKGTWYLMIYAYAGRGPYNLTVSFVFGVPGLSVYSVLDFFLSPLGITLFATIAVVIGVFAYYKFHSPRRADKVITGYEEHLAPQYDSIYYDKPRFCTYCGTQFILGSNICHKCGARKPLE